MDVSVADYLESWEGKRQVKFLAIAFVGFELFSVLMMWNYGIRRTTTRTSPWVRDGIPLGLTAALALWLYRGSNVARWLTIVCYGLSGVATIVIGVSRAIFVPEVYVAAAFYLFAVSQLIWSRPIKKYFDVTRAMWKARRAGTPGHASSVDVGDLPELPPDYGRGTE